MNILSEQPIKDKSEDKLKRTRFSTNFADKINSYEYDAPITLGLMGSWGSGKTSIINMVKSNIDISKICIIDFNPWYFSGRKQLISDYFEILANEIGIKNGVLSKLGEDLSLYSKALKPLALIPPLTPFINILMEVSKSSGNFINEYSKAQKANISKIKEQINKEIRECDQKFLIIIDEIDRLENEEIKEIFQLVRAVGDFDNIIYLLSFDKEKVSNVFSSGEDYLDKIINVPLYVPEISNKNINEVFINELGNIFDKKVKIDSKYWSEVFKCVFENKFINLREVNRFLNIIRFNVEGIIRDLNPIDYLVVSFLRMFDEDVLKFIKDKKESLLNRDKVNDMYSLINAMKIKSKKSIDLKCLIKLLFYNDKSLPKRGIRIRKCFDSYFQYSLEDDVFTISEIEEYSRIKTKEHLLDKITDKSTIELIYLFDNLNDIADTLKSCQIYFYEEALIEKIVLFDKSPKNSFAESQQNKAFKNLKEMVLKLPPDDINIAHAINNFKFNENYELKSLLEYLILVKEHFNDVKIINILSMKLEKYLYQIKNTDEINNNFRLLRQLDFNVENYIKNLIKEDSGLIAYLKSLVEIVETNEYQEYDDNGDVNGIDFVDEEAIVLDSIENYIDYGYVKNRVDKISDIDRNINKNLVKLFYQARPYEEVYARMIAQEKAEAEY